MPPPYGSGTLLQHKSLIVCTVTSARLARITGALSGLVSKKRGLPGMFAPTNHEFAWVRRIFEPASATCWVQAASASGVGTMRWN